jgi:hypothetical protein
MWTVCDCLDPSRPADRYRGFLARFAAHASGLASGLALAVRPAGPVEAPGSTARQRRVPRSRMRSTVEAGGTGPDNARRSGPGDCDTLPAIHALGVRLTAWSCCWRARHREGAAGSVGGRSPGSRARQPPRRRACGRRTRRKLPPRNGEFPGEPQPPTAGHPSRSLPSTACGRPRCSRPGRQAWRAEGAPLKPWRKRKACNSMTGPILSTGTGTGTGTGLGTAAADPIHQHQLQPVPRRDRTQLRGRYPVADPGAAPGGANRQGNVPG